MPRILWKSRIPDDKSLFAAGKNQFEQYNRIKIYAGIGTPLHGNAQKARIQKEGLLQKI